MGCFCCLWVLELGLRRGFSWFWSSSWSLIEVRVPHRTPAIKGPYGLPRALKGPKGSQKLSRPSRALEHPQGLQKPSGAPRPSSALTHAQAPSRAFKGSRELLRALKGPQGLQGLQAPGFGARGFQGSSKLRGLTNSKENPESPRELSVSLLRALGAFEAVEHLWSPRGPSTPLEPLRARESL